MSLFSLVEGLYPERDSPNNFIPGTLLQNLDFNSMVSLLIYFLIYLFKEITMKNALEFSEIRSNFENLQLKIQSGNKKLLKSIPLLGDSEGKEEVFQWYLVLQYL